MKHIPTTYTQENHVKHIVVFKRSEIMESEMIEAIAEGMM